MKTTRKKIKRLIVEAVIKYADGSKAENAKGVFSRVSLEKLFQTLYDESLEYQKGIISNPDGYLDKTIIELAQANAAAKLHRQLESMLTAKYGSAAAIIFNLSDYEPRNEKEIVNFPSLEKAVKRASGYNVEHILYSGNTRDFPDISAQPTDRPSSERLEDLVVKPIEGESVPHFDISTLSFDDDEDTVPRDEYEPTKVRFEPTGVLPAR